MYLYYLLSSGPGVASAAILQAVGLIQSRSLKFFTYLFSVNIPSLISPALTRWIRVQLRRRHNVPQVELVRQILPGGLPQREMSGRCSGPLGFCWHFNHGSRSPLNLKTPQAFRCGLGTTGLSRLMLS